MAEIPISQKVALSREENRNMIIAELKKYLELENVDLTKSSFLSFVVEALATLTSNLMFYQTSVYREFFLTKAQLPESIYNLAAFLGYEGGLASFSNVDVLFTMPFGFSEDTTFIIPEGFKVNANDGVEFLTYYKTTITIEGNSSVVITAQEGTKVFNVPVVIEDSVFSFALNFKQLTFDIQEFQIPSDLQIYQFYSTAVPFEAKLAEILVEVREPGETGWDTYTEYSSLYLMDENTRGYVGRRSDTGIDLSFGNGIIGYQPPAGSTVRVTLTLTQGEDGNVIAGSIRTGDRIYNETDAGVTEIVSYDIVNTIAATGGSDEEGVEEIRRNSIANIAALERTVTEQDYVDSNIIIDDSPIGPNSLPVLKRSDVKVNEIDLFITLLYQGLIVPTRNAFETFNNTVIPRKTILDINGVDFYTLFDMIIDSLNTVADYNYVMFQIEQVPTLVTSFNSDYSLYADNLIVTTAGTSQAEYRLLYNTTADDPEDVTAKMLILETGAEYDMVNDSSANEFVLIFPDYTAIDEGELTYFFTLEHPSEGLIGRYQNSFILRQSLENYTRSNVFQDGTNYTVYDIPVIEKDYYDGVDQREFETQVLQSLLSSMTFEDYKMMTDFVNIKFGNTTGRMQNMQLNDVNTQAVIDFRSDPGDPCGPVGSQCTQGQRYIVLNGRGEFEGHDNDIAECTRTTSDSTAADSTAVTWVYTTPNTDDMVYVDLKGFKYIYGAGGWVLPNYLIPLQLKLDVFQTSEYTGSISTLATTIRDTLVAAFADRFGIEINLYRSEIIEVVQEIDGVDHCRLLDPGSNIFFNFDLTELTQEQLLEYGPEYIYFTTDDIEIKIFK
ncbi:MAG: hypothetical protein ACTSVB_08785 [Candidatus Heimdallarchaeaceae archaeon]